MKTLLNRLHCPAALTRALLLTPFAVPLFAMASPGSEALRALAQDDWVQRSVSLADLGISNPVVLEESDNRQAFFLPVPKGVPLHDAAIKVQGSFLKGEAANAALKMSVDGRPLFARPVTETSGTLQQVLPVETYGHTSGFVNFTIDWSSPSGQRLCEPTRQSSNILTLSPHTELTYRYSKQALHTLADAWSTLPGQPVIMIAAGSLEQTSFDSAWRLGVALERAAKRAQVRAFPAVGDVVSIDELNIPTALSSVAPFSALAGKASHTVANAAELGALLVLDAPATRADLAIADAALIGQINAALDALRTALQADSDALKALDEWRSRHATLSLKPLASQQVRLASLGHQAVIGVAGDAGAKAAGVFDSQWRNVLISPEATIHAAGEDADEQRLRITDLGGSPTAFDVVTRGEWNAVFPLSAVAADGRMPGELVLEVAAAPGASSTLPVASVLWNGILLNARQLTADGKPERLSARVPGYALGVTNTLQIRFQRQPVSPNCAEIPQGYPVNVLPTSFLRSAEAEADGTFVGLLPLLAGHSQVIVPGTALQAPAAHLRQVIRLASAASVSPVHAELTLADGAQAFKPTRPFLALGVNLDGAKPLIDVKELQRLRAGGDNNRLLDLQGPQPLSAVSVVNANSQPGVVWYALGEQVLTPREAFVLNRGNAVVLGEDGPLTWIDTTDPELSQKLGLSGTPFHQWRQYLAWTLPLLATAVLGMLLLGVLARRSRLKKTGK
ncbi:hypothetical protein [Pseudomonas aegrilactucae]|uniref:Cyclic di-GMP-binding protein n=1 Tax=Pseudomonas aegrilactucae TaxID=2854028 RepID=A0A9Q2XMA4_9PSED|nr:hypothetical protein [Pseudomonas aegrilactucae]MBV6288894.1 hypothetical protein [Pseudomonas aegrilactucae]